MTWQGVAWQGRAGLGQIGSGLPTNCRTNWGSEVGAWWRRIWTGGATWIGTVHVFHAGLQTEFEAKWERVGKRAGKVCKVDQTSRKGAVGLLAGKASMHRTTVSQTRNPPLFLGFHFAFWSFHEKRLSEHDTSHRLPPHRHRHHHAYRRGTKPALDSYQRGAPMWTLQYERRECNQANHWRLQGKGD